MMSRAPVRLRASAPDRRTADTYVKVTYFILKNEAMKKKQFKELGNIIPVNYVCNGPHHCDNKNIQ